MASSIENAAIENADGLPALDSGTSNWSDCDWPELLAAAKAGDREAFGEIAQQLRKYLLLIANASVPSGLRKKCAASDLVQQSLLEAQQGFGSFTGSSEQDLRRWLGRIMRNNLTDTKRHYRKKKRDTSREIPLNEVLTLRGTVSTPSSIVRRRETGDELLRAVAMLPPRRRQIVELRHREGLDYAVISNRLGITEVAARKLWSRSLEQLRSILERDLRENGHASDSRRPR